MSEWRLKFYTLWCGVKARVGASLSDLIISEVAEFHPTRPSKFLNLAVCTSCTAWKAQLASVLLKLVLVITLSSVLLRKLILFESFDF